MDPVDLEFANEGSQRLTVSPLLSSFARDLSPSSRSLAFLLDILRQGRQAVSSDVPCLLYTESLMGSPV